MSAFLCSVRHFNALATFAQRQRVQLTLDNGDYLDTTNHHGAQALLDILLAANLEGLRARYPAEWKEPRAVQFEPTRNADDLEPVVVLKQCQALSYQCCEFAGFEESDAAAIVRVLIAKAIRALHGYERTPWGLEGDEPAIVRPQLQPAPGKATRGDLMAMLFPAGPVDLDEDTPAAPVAVKPAPAPAPKPTPKPSKPAKPADEDQQDGPF